MTMGPRWAVAWVVVGVATCFSGGGGGLKRLWSWRRCAQFGGRSGCCVKADSYLERLSRPGEPCEANAWHLEWVTLLDASLRECAGRGVVPSAVSAAECEGLAKSESIVVVSHDLASSGADGPVFNYATRAGLELFDLSWRDFVRLPSKFSAEPDDVEARAKLMDDVLRNGFASNYTGVRRASSGARFLITDVSIWNVRDKSGDLVGQAAMFQRDKVQFLSSSSSDK